MIARHRLFVSVLLVAGVAAVGCQRHAAPQKTTAAPAGGAAPDAVLKPYLAIQEGLAKDSLDGLSANAAAIAEASHALGDTGAGVGADAVKLQAASTLPDARERFGALSETLVGYGKAHGWKLPADVREAFCPMVQKPWLQRGSMISNPYYGKEMPGCGEFK